MENFPEGLYFHLKASSDQEIQRVFLLYGSEGRSCQPGGARLELEVYPSTAVALSWEWDFTLSGSLPPGAQIWWQWEITDAGGNILLTGKKTARLQDQRNTWRHITQNRVTVEWYQGSQAYATQIHAIALESLERLEGDVGLRPQGEIWLTIYPSFEKLRQSQKFSADWTGGMAYPAHNAILLAVPEGAMDWAREVVPHELAHLVSGEVVFNCRGATLPTWLEEGLAEYAVGPVSEEDLASLQEAEQAGDLPALRSLEVGFSAYTKEANLSYMQSASVVAYLLETYTPQKMTELIEVVKEGRRIDEALQRVYGFDCLGLDNAWRAAMGFSLLPEQLAETTPKAAATRIPTMALWTSAVRPTETATATLTPLPTHTPAPSHTPVAPPTETVEPPEQPSSRPPSILSTGGLVGGAGVVVLAVAIYFVVRRRRRT